MLTPSDRAELSRLLVLYRDELTAEVEAADTSKSTGRFDAHFAVMACRNAQSLIERLKGAKSIP